MVDERQRRKAWGLPPTPAKALACVRSSALGVDLIEREAVEAGRNFIRRRAIPKEAKPSMADLPERDAAPLLDMLLAAGDARWASSRGSTKPLSSRAGCTRTRPFDRSKSPVSAATRAADPQNPLARNHVNAPSSHPRLMSAKIGGHRANIQCNERLAQQRNGFALCRTDLLLSFPRRRERKFAATPNSAVGCVGRAASSCRAKVVDSSSRAMITLS